MEIKTYAPDDGSALAELLRKKYGMHASFGYFAGDADIAYAFCTESDHISFTPIAGYEEGEMVAHIALIADARQPGEAFFGFLETPNGQETFDLLWDELLRQSRARGITLLKGPISGSIWHQYRCIKESDGSPFFTGEPMTETYYYDLLAAKRPVTEVTYFSAYRTRYDMVLRLLGAASYKRLSLSGFTIKEVTQAGPEELRTIVEISEETFRASWGYTGLTEKEFLRLYSAEKMGEHLSTLYLLYKGDKLIGFLGTAREDDSTLICKTICIAPPYQGKGLGNALAYKVHLDAGKRGFTKVVYALIREGNAIQRFPKEQAVVFRKYAAFEFSL